VQLAEFFLMYSIFHYNLVCLQTLILNIAEVEPLFVARYWSYFFKKKKRKIKICKVNDLLGISPYLKTSF